MNSSKSHVGAITSAEMEEFDLGDFELDHLDIHQADLEQLKKMLPNLQQSATLSQLEIILKTIQYIEVLQSQLKKE